MNPLLQLKKQGQAVWLDYVRRMLITGGELKRLVHEDGLTGVTSNPTIFEKAISGSSDYDEQIKKLIGGDVHLGAKQIFEALAFKDIQMAADVLRPVYEETNGADGFVSLELPPDLAYDTESSIAEARRYWKEVDRPNIMLKVPATKEGIPVVEQLISEGINVNITLMFSIEHYDAVSEAYIRGLERCKDPSKVASVASFFVSRVDTIVDKALDEIGSEEALSLKGKIAVANAKVAYKRFKAKFSGERWEKLAGNGAMVQRVLWASTGTKNPEYSDVLYVEELIGRDTVNTMPPATMDDFRGHGKVRDSILEGMEEAQESLKKLSELGVDLGMLTEKLQRDGAESFKKSYETLISTLENKAKTLSAGEDAGQKMNLGSYQSKADKRLAYLKNIEFIRRLGQKDSTLWSDRHVPDITDRLGWFTLPERMHERLEALKSFAEEIRKEGFQHVMLLGVGGSSLASEVFQRTFGNAQGYPNLIVLDSTHPDAVRGAEENVILKKTFFIVASKSGSTLEPLSFYRYFYNRLSEVKSNPDSSFIAITDQNSPLAELARKNNFRKIFYAHPDLGGRYSALTLFGMVPAALIGLDVHKLLDRAWRAKEGCTVCVPEAENPGLVLGAALGELALAGRNKATMFTPDYLSSFPDWLEQLIAESTGKDGKGLVPITGEPLMLPENYSKDRVFVAFAIKGRADKDIEMTLEGLEKLGHPVIRITLSDKMDLGQEIFKWELAIATAGAVIGVHPFNQPDVELAKKLAREHMEKTATESYSETNAMNRKVLNHNLADWISLAGEGDYASVMAYLNPSKEITSSLEKIRSRLLSTLKIPVTLGFGPRFLHSTGQLHKGGPNQGLFLQLVDDPEKDVPVPETDYTFKKIIQAQSVGDYLALKERGRRVIRINLDRDVNTGLESIAEFLVNYKGV